MIDALHDRRNILGRDGCWPLILRNGCAIANADDPWHAILWPMQVNALSTPIHFEYRWQEGSVPPPDHFGFSVAGMTNGDGHIVLVPGYPCEKCAPWVKTFHVDPLKAAALEAFLHTAKVFDRQWVEATQDTVGGSQRTFCLRAGARRVDIPAGLSAVDAHIADALERLVQSLVPDDVWQALRNRHASYVESYCR